MQYTSSVITFFAGCENRTKYAEDRIPAPYRGSGNSLAEAVTAPHTQVPRWAFGTGGRATRLKARR